MRTGQIAAMLLTALALEGCYAQYNYRPAGYEEGWTMGHHAGHLGWYDQHGHWRGWFDGAAWHDAHETAPNRASSLLPGQSAPVGRTAPALRGPANSSGSSPVRSQEEAPSAINPVPEAAQEPVPHPAPIAPPAHSTSIPATPQVATPAVPTPALTPPRTPAPPAVTPAAPQPSVPASVPAPQPAPVVQTPPPVQSAPAPTVQPSAPVQTPDEEETAPSTPTAQQAPFKVKPGSSMPQGPDESTSAASQVLPAWLAPSPDPVMSSQPATEQSSGRATRKTTR